MSAASIPEPATAELASFDAFNRRQFMCQDASILNTMHTNGQVRASCRALRVLVVDGQQDTANARVELTHRLGHTTFLAFDGFAALRVAVANQPDVVVLDIGLALVESCQIARHLRFDFPRRNVWIIAVTGRIDDDRRRKCADAGIDVLLTEAVDPDVFETLLMLECMRVNRSEADESEALTGKGSIPVHSHDNVN